MTAPATPPRTATISAKDPSVKDLISKESKAEAPAPSWSTDDAEALLRTLPAIASARLLRDADGTVRDVHVLATTDLAPKQIVRNVESALLARFGIRLDHRAISLGGSVSLSNVLDRRYDTSVVPNAAGGRFFEPGPGRTATVMVELSRRIGAR